MKWILPVLILVLGLLIAAGGLLYGGITVGVPTQDASPAIAAAESRNMAISGWCMISGVILALVGFAWIVGTTLRSFITKK